MINEIPQNKYSLIKCERHFKDKVLISLYNKNNQPVEKKFIPIVKDGYKMRLNKETGEIEYYDTKTCDYSFNCSIRRTKILLGMILEMNSFDYFCTFTFDNKWIDRKNDEEVYTKFKYFCCELKRKFPNLQYVIVPERHKIRTKISDNNEVFEIEFEDQRGVLHFHMLLGLNGHTINELGFTRTDKVCCSWATKKNGIANIEYYNKTKHLHEQKPTDGVRIFHITGFKLGYTTASRIVSEEACKHYVKKYISKSIGLSTSAFKKRFYYTHNLNVPEIVKTEIGSGIDSPVNLYNNTDYNLLNDLRKAKVYNDDIYEAYNSEHNVLQYWFGKDKYSEFEYGRKINMIPIKCSTPFDNILEETEI